MWNGSAAWSGGEAAGEPGLGYGSPHEEPQFYQHSYPAPGPGGDSPREAPHHTHHHSHQHVHHRGPRTTADGVPHLARDRALFFGEEARAGLTTAGPAHAEQQLRADEDGAAASAGHESERSSESSSTSSSSSASPRRDARLTYADKLYSNNDQTFHEAYWEHPPPPPITALQAGPFCYPRALQDCTNEREKADFDSYTTREFGGQGVDKLIKARQSEEHSWGYEWIHTVLVSKGRSLPSLPTIILILWSVFVTIICMIPCNFYQVRVGLETRTMDIFTLEWQRQIYAFAEGLEIPSDLIGSAITFLLVFRVNTGYERWWEGRKTFRDVVNSSRNVARQVAAHVTDFALAEKMMRWVVVLVYMLKAHVRQETNVDELRGVVSDDALNLLSKARNKPHLAAQRLSELVAAAIADQDIHDELVMMFDSNIADLVSCIGTCDMILSTPMPFAYVAHLRTFILIWMALLPPLLCVHVGWATIPCMLMILVLFLGLDSISGEIENPFGYDWNDLPLDKIMQELVLDIKQSTLMMLDMPLDQDPVTDEDLAGFTLRAFGAHALLKSKQTPVRPVFPPDSLFLRRFRQVLGTDAEDCAEPGPSTRERKKTVQQEQHAMSPVQLLTLADDAALEARAPGMLAVNWRAG